MEYVKLDELCRDIIDCPHTTPKWRDEGIPVIRNYNLSDGCIDMSKLSYVDEETYHSRIKRAKPEPGDIIISREAPIGTVGIIPEGLKCCLGQRLVLLKANRQKCVPKYLLYALMSEQVQAQLRKAEQTGSIVSSLNIPELKALKVPLVDVGTQEKIAHTLSVIDDLIQNLRLRSELMQRQIRLLYEHWFVRFDFPDANGRPYKSSGGKMIWNEAEGRYVPEGWEVCELLDVISWNGGSQPPKSEHINHPREGYVRFIQNRDYSDDSHLTFIPVSKKNKLCSEYDIMIDKYGDAGQTRFGIAGAYNVALSRIDVKRSSAQEYVRRYLESDAVKQYLSGACIASTRASLNEDDMSFLRIVMPCERVLSAFESCGKKVIRLCLANKKETEELLSLKHWLLPLLLNGQPEIR